MRTGADSNDEARRSEDPARLKDEIEGIRENLTGLVGELDRRRREMFNLPLQIRRHPLVLAGAALAVGGLVALGVFLTVRSRRKAKSIPARLRRLRRALVRAAADDDTVVVTAQPRSLGGQILKLGGAATVAYLGRGVAGRRLAKKALASL
jgi:hypothetical protein